MTAAVLLHLGANTTTVDLSEMLVAGSTWRVTTQHQPGGAASLLRNMSTAVRGVVTTDDTTAVVVQAYAVLTLELVVEEKREQRKVKSDDNAATNPKSNSIECCHAPRKASTMRVAVTIGNADGARRPNAIESMASKMDDSPAGVRCCNGFLHPERCAGEKNLSGLCPAGHGCDCVTPGWVPASWLAEARAADRLIGAPDEPGPAH